MLHNILHFFLKVHSTVDTSVYHITQVRRYDNRSKYYEQRVKQQITHTNSRHNHSRFQNLNHSETNTSFTVLQHEFCPQSSSSSSNDNNTNAFGNVRTEATSVESKENKEISRRRGNSNRLKQNAEWRCGGMRRAGRVMPHHVCRRSQNEPSWVEYLDLGTHCRSFSWHWHDVKTLVCRRQCALSTLTKVAWSAQWFCLISGCIHQDLFISLHVSPVRTPVMLASCGTKG